MQRIVDSNAIISVSKKITEYLELLNDAKNTLKTDIDSISSVYQGKDSTMIINKYLERIDKIDGVITDYTTIATFLKKVGEAYLTNLNETKAKMSQLIGEDVPSSSPDDGASGSGSSETPSSEGTQGSSSGQGDLSQYKRATVKTGGGKLYVRKSPSSKGKKIGKLKNGAEIAVVKKGKTWTKIATKDKNGNIVYGYVATKYISMQD